MKAEDYYVGSLYKFPASHIPQPHYISPKRRDTVEPTRGALKVFSPEVLTYAAALQ